MKMQTIRVMAAMLAVTGVGVAAAQTIPFQGRVYRLGSHSAKTNPMWEYVTGTETVNNWTTLLTVVDRPDAKLRPDLDRLSEGILNTYKARGGQILMAKTMVDGAGKPFNYTLAAFEEPGEKRFELNFVKAAMGEKNAYMLIYGVRISGGDYLAKAKAFLKANSQEIGMALEKAADPGTARLPRKVF